MKYYIPVLSFVMIDDSAVSLTSGSCYNGREYEFYVVTNSMLS